LIGLSLLVIWPAGPWWSSLLLAALAGFLVQVMAVFGLLVATAAASALLKKPNDHTLPWDDPRLLAALLLFAASWVWGQYDKKREREQIISCIRTYSYEIDRRRPEELARWCAMEYRESVSADER
jgi:hypothetical protein